MIAIVQRDVDLRHRALIREQDRRENLRGRGGRIADVQLRCIGAGNCPRFFDCFIDGRNVLELIALDPPERSTVHILAEGPDAANAMHTVEQLI